MSELSLRFPHTVLQIRRGNRDNLGIISYIFKTFCDPSLEPPHGDSFNEGSQHMFLLRNKKNIFECPQYPLLSGALINEFHLVKNATFMLAVLK